MTAKIFSFLVINILCLVCASLAHSADDAIGSSLIPYSLEALKVVFSLAFVLLIFYLGITVFKKYTGYSFKANSTIKILGGLSLGGKEKVVLIEAGNVNLLLGVSASGVTALHRFADEELLDNKEKDQEELIDFNSHLDRSLNKKI